MWSPLPAGPCPITDYKIDVGDTTISVGTRVTSFKHPFGDDSCGTTLQISVYAINPAGMGTKTVQSNAITCTGTKGLFKLFDMKMGCFAGKYF